MTDIKELCERLRERAEGYRQSGPSAEHTAALLTEAADALEATGRERGWQPIETAPRDGTMFLVGYDDESARQARLEPHQRVYEARWNDVQESFSARNGFILHDHATHWLPLPTPPARQARQQGGA